MRLLPAAVLTLAVTVCALPARADDVTDAIKAALDAYEAGDLVEAKFSLDTAAQLVGAARAKGLQAALPAPFEGWTAEADDGGDMSMASAFLGGAIASRSYRNTDGDSVTIAIMADSPMVAQMLAIVGNPQLAASMGKSLRVGKQRGLETSSGELQIVVGNRALVTIDGSADLAAKKAYAEAVDFEAVTNF